MLIYVWDRWPQFFRGRLRVLFEVTGEVRREPRAPLGLRGPGAAGAAVAGGRLACGWSG